MDFTALGLTGTERKLKFINSLKRLQRVDFLKGNFRAQAPGERQRSLLPAESSDPEARLEGVPSRNSAGESPDANIHPMVVAF